MEYDFTFADRLGRTIDVSEHHFEFKAWHEGELLGSLAFNLVEREYPHPDCLLLINAHLEALPGYKHCGIGSEIVKTVGEAYGYPLLIRRHDGIVRDDGSHLTGNAPAFACAMVERGLMNWYSVD